MWRPHAPHPINPIVVFLLALTSHQLSWRGRLNAHGSLPQADYRKTPATGTVPVCPAIIGVMYRGRRGAFLPVLRD